MDDIAKIFLGALISIVVTFLSEELKKRRRLWASARVLLHELQRAYNSAGQRGPDEILNSKGFLAAVDEYRAALFAVDSAAFERHFPVYAKLTELLDSDLAPDHKETLLVLDIRRRLGALLGHEKPGAAELIGVPETGSPVSYRRPNDKQEQD